jgi:hypothetical protein
MTAAFSQNLLIKSNIHTAVAAFKNFPPESWQLGASHWDYLAGWSYLPRAIWCSFRA